MRSDERNRQNQNQQRPQDNAKQTANELKQDAKQTASQMSEKMKQEAQGQFSQNKEAASREIEKVAHAARAAASDLGEQNRENLSHYVSDLADNLSSIAQNLRSKNVDELAHEVTGLARRNPTLFVAGSLAIGLGLARFAKASSSHSSQTSQFGQSQSRAGYGADPSLAGRESDAAADWPGGYSSDFASGDYAKTDFPTGENPNLAAGQSLPGGDSRSDNRGGKGYE